MVCKVNHHIATPIGYGKILTLRPTPKMCYRSGVPLDSEGRIAYRRKFASKTIEVSSQVTRLQKA